MTFNLVQMDEVLEETGINLYDLTQVDVIYYDVHGVCMGGGKSARGIAQYRVMTEEGFLIADLPGVDPYDTYVDVQERRQKRKKDFEIVQTGSRFTNIPNNTKVSFEQQEHIIDDGELEVSFDHVGDHTLKFSGLQYREVTFVVTTE